MLLKEIYIAPDGTHHIFRNAPLYRERFDEVLKFHEPGLAPVRRGSEAWHIRTNGSPAYDQRFLRTFGFYEGFAAVISEQGWLHIAPDGSSIYPERYDWCGNFQNGRCPVRNSKGEYFHINLHGKPAYTAKWRYAGDFRDGIAVVQRDDGRSTHIDQEGKFVHGQWYLDLDVFHKGFARARDQKGWMHVDFNGHPIYERRFAAVEPFYNGQARVECFDGSLVVIDERGENQGVLRHQLPSVPYRNQMLGKWLVGREIARSSEGAVYDSPPDKVIKSTSNLSAWRREVEMLNYLNGKGAPYLYDAFWRSYAGYLVLEKIQGKTLGKRNFTEKKPTRYALQLIRTLLYTVEKIHKYGWIHTDIHPDNIIDHNRKAVLLDPAYAVKVSRHGFWSGEVHWGRWEFIPPEQFVGFTTLTQSVDTYAICGLLSYMITGHGPFVIRIKTLKERNWNFLKSAFLEKRLNPDIQELPDNIKSIISRGLSIHVEDRYADATELLKALEGLDE